MSGQQFELAEKMECLRQGGLEGDTENVGMAWCGEDTGSGPHWLGTCLLKSSRKSSSVVWDHHSDRQP